MADALISPAVGGTMWAVTTGLLAWCARRLRQAARERLAPMMGVFGAFVFAAQMLNFSIPGTGSSGHLGGGLLLTILLGPCAAFLVMASILAVQALFFADGGLLALGCNIFNLGFFPAFIAYPLIYRPLAGSRIAGGRATVAAVMASTVGLLLGAMGVVIQTRASGISQLPFGPFVALMLPIHAAIGAVEGLVTAAVVAWAARARPETAAPSSDRLLPARAQLALLALAAWLGGVGSWFASSHPDGLEWSIARTAGVEELDAPAGGVHERLASLQQKTSFLPDYDFPAPDGDATQPSEDAPAWPVVNAGTTLAGLVGGAITLAVAAAIGAAVRAGARRRSPAPTAAG